MLFLYLDVYTSFMPSWLRFLREKPTSSSAYQVLVRDVKTVLFDGEAETISSFNQLGPFDIMPGHSFFISLIHRKVVIRSKSQKEVEFPLEQGILRLKGNKVTIFLGLEVLSPSTDKPAA